MHSFNCIMIDNHTNAQAELAAIAKNENVTLPDSTDDEHRRFKQRLMLVTGNSFDSAYMQSQVRDHVKTIALFQAKISIGKDAQSLAGNTGMNNMQH
jgi:putative membrane protein